MVKRRSSASLCALCGVAMLWVVGAARGHEAEPAIRAGAPADFVEQAVAAFIAGDPTDEAGPELWTLSAAPSLDFRANPGVLGRLWVAEVSIAAGEAGLMRRAVQEAEGSGETPRAVFARLIAELARSEDHVLVRAAARLFTSVEPEAGPSRLRIFDYESGALDAAPPAPFSVRHRSLIPDGATDTLRLTWPPDGGDGAAVVRYADAALPPDVVFFRPGDRRAIPLSGVARVDFLVAGAEGGGRGIRAPVECVRDPAIPFARLEARAAVESGGPRLQWTTASHDGIWGWAVFREQVLPDGRIARTGPNLVPSAERADESYGYAYLDTAASPGTFYRYTVWAVTEEGLLARAFAATVATGR